MRLEITKNFLSLEECQFLNSWAYQGVEKKWLDAGINNKGDSTNLRLTTRLYGDRFDYPQEIIDLSNKIRKFAGVESFPIIHNLHPPKDEHNKELFGLQEKNGIVVSFIKPNGNLDKHQDAKYMGLSALRCNIITQLPDSGGYLFIDNKKIDVEVGDLHCYLASDFEHYVTKVEGQTPRILWMFGAYLPKEYWENGDIKYGLS